MMEWAMARWMLIAALAVTALQGMSQQDEGPILRPKTQPTKTASATLLVMCDLACNWELDGKPMGHIDPGNSAKAKVVSGPHLVVGTSEDGLDQVEQLEDVKEKGQAAITVVLKSVRDARLRDQRDHSDELLREGRAFYDQKRYEEARPLFQKACEGGNIAGCNSEGILYDYGRGVAQDFVQARALYQKACDGGEMAGCYGLGWIYHFGQGVTQDYAQSLISFQKACDAGYMDGCTGLGYLFASGHGESLNYTQARLLYEKACDGGSMDGCSRLGKLYFSGNGVTVDYQQAHSLYQKACDGGNMAGCVDLGDIYFTGKGATLDYAQARILYQKACDGDSMVACVDLGYLYASGHGESVDYARAGTLYRKACDGGNMAGCADLGSLYVSGHGMTLDYAQARLLYEKACSGGDMKGCNNLGSLYAKGTGVAKDYMQARALYKKACDGGFQAACNSLREAQEEAEPTWTDPATGLMWTKKDNGDSVSWQQAMYYCRNLQMAGHDDWRLPTINELSGINENEANIYGKYLKGNLFLNSDVWSSSQAPGNKGRTDDMALVFGPSRYGPRISGVFLVCEGCLVDALCVRGPAHP
jgi:TPR repeat protein